MEYECLFPDKNIPLLTSAAEEINIVRDKLLDGNQLEQYSLARILILVSKFTSKQFINILKQIYAEIDIYTETVHINIDFHGEIGSQFQRFFLLMVTHF